MVEKKISCLAVTVDALLVGIVSKAELDELEMLDDKEVEVEIDELCSSCGSMFLSSSRFVLPGVPLCDSCVGNVAAIQQRPQA